MNPENYEKLIKAADNYYSGEPTGMSDEEYDKLLNEAKQANPEFDIFKAIKTGSDRADVKHTIPFTPQAFKVQFHSLEELKSILNENDNKDWVVTPKWDGSSIRAYYKNGKLFDIVTRSNEDCGKRKFDSLYNKVPHNVDSRVIAIDFEALCSKEDFNDDTRSNANGLINSCYKQDEVNLYLRLIPFKVTTSECMKYVDAMNLVFNPKYYVLLNESTVSYDNRFIEYHGKHYPIDGIVLYYDTVQPHRIYKHYFNENPRSIVTNIEWNFTDKLCWVPKVQFNEVKIDGRHVWQATSNGFGRLKSIKAGIGAEIEIILANSTIPQVHKVITPSENYNEPKVCPYCNSPIINVNDKLRCSNQFCSNIISWISGWFNDAAKNGMNSVNNIDDFHDIIIQTKDNITQDKMLECIAYSFNLERFSKYGQIAKLFIDHKNDLFNGMDSLELISELLTWNQYCIYVTLKDLINKLIQFTKEVY